MMTDKKRAELIGREADKYAEEPNSIVEWGDGWEDHNDYDQVFKAFQAGAKWADENPKISKRDFINNAKEFLKDAFDSRYGENSIYAAMDLERLLWEFNREIN